MLRQWCISRKISGKTSVPILSTLNHIATIFSCCVLWCSAHIDRLCTLSCVFVAASSFFSTHDSSSESIMHRGSTTEQPGARISPSLTTDQRRKVTHKSDGVARNKSSGSFSNANCNRRTSLILFFDLDKNHHTKTITLPVLCKSRLDLELDYDILCTVLGAQLIFSLQNFTFLFQ